MENIYKSIVNAVVFGNVIAFPAIAFTFPWDTYLIDPSTYYIVQSLSLGLLIAICIFVYEWVKYADKTKIKSITLKIKKPSRKK
jgi:hypothetical protein